jgi:outer membrane protein
MSKKYSFILSLLLSIHTAYAQQPGRMKLEECIQFALNNQPAVLNAALDEEIARNKVNEVIGIGLPQASGSVTFQDFIDIPTTLLPGAFFGDSSGRRYPVQFGTKYILNSSIDASQILFDGSYLLGVKASGVYKQLAISNLHRTRTETAVTVSKAYYTALVNEERMSLLDANLRRTEKVLEDTRVLYRNGIAEKIDLDRIQVLYNNLRTEKEFLESQLMLSRQVLAFQIGMPASSQVIPAEKITELMVDTLFLRTEADPVKRIEYSIMETQVRLRKLELQRNRISYLPSLIAFGSLANTAQSSSFSEVTGTSINRYPSTVIGLKLTMPLTGGGQKYFRTKQAGLELQKTENSLQQLENSIRLEITSAEAAYRYNLSALEVQKENMELAKEVLRVAKNKYDQGLGSGLEMITAETAYKEAQTHYITVLFNALMAKADLGKASGAINY